MKVFAYMLMLEDPQPPPFICIEEPKNGLYHCLGRRIPVTRYRTPQIFVTTHQPYFVDALAQLEKQDDGFATKDPIVSADCLLAYSEYLEPEVV